MLFNTVPVTVSALLLSAAQLCSAVNMSQYDPQTGVQAEFKEFLTAFVQPTVPPPLKASASPAAHMSMFCPSRMSPETC